MNFNFKQYKSLYVFLFTFFALLYSFFMINQLTNVGDGFWQQDYYFAGGHEISCGRWLWPLLDKALRGIHVDPLTTLISIALFVAGYIVIIDTLEIRNRIASIIGGLIFFSSPVLSSVLSYKYMSITFALAFFLSALSIYVCIKTSRNIPAVAISAVLFAMSMGLYQAYSGVFCLIGAISVVILLLSHKTSAKQIVTRFLRVLISFIAGGAVYYIILSIVLKLTGNSLNSYNGADEVSVLSIITNLPKSVKETYSLWYRFITGDLLYLNELDFKIPVTVVYYFILIALTIVLFTLFVTRNKKTVKTSLIRALIALLIIFILPMLCNVANILAYSAGFMPQMGAAMALCPAVISVLAIDRFNLSKTSKMPYRAIAIICAVLSIMISYGQSIQVLIDHSIMKEGYTATVSMAEGIVEDLKQKDLLSPERSYFFILKVV